MNAMMVHVRQATMQDAASIARIDVETWRATYAGMLPDRLLVGLSAGRRASTWAMELSRHPADILVAENEKHEILGFGSCGAQRSARIDYGGEIYTLYVTPDLQGNGIGRQLLLGLFSRLLRAGHNSAALWVLQGNPSRYFYERLGGTLALRKSMTVGGQTVEAVAYGWLDLPTVLHQQARATHRPGEGEA